MDQVNRRLLLLVTEYHGAEHDFFGKLFRFRFDHQHRGLGARDNEIELGCRHQLGLARIEHVLVVDVTDARRANRTVKWHAG